MKVDIHSTYVGHAMTPDFYKSVTAQLPSLIAPLFERKISKLQFYDTFFNKDGSYPFLDADTVYYPLSVLFYNRTWDTVWISWPRRADVEKYLAQWGPYGTFSDIAFSVAPKVDERFSQAIKGKNLCWFSKKDMPSPEIGMIDVPPPTIKGKYNQAFADVLTLQMGDILWGLADKPLNPNWHIEIPARNTTVTVNDMHYRKVELKNGIADVLSISVVWKEDYDVGDYVEDSDIQFMIAETCPGTQVATFEDIIGFIRRGGHKW